MRSLIWFRRDLRVTDNTALYHAAENSDEGVVAVFVITAKQWKLHDDADCKIKFWLKNLETLSSELGKLNIPLLVEACETFVETPGRLLELARKHRCSALFFNKEYEVNESRRDDAVEAAFAVQDFATYSFHDRVIVPPSEIATKDGRFYSVFTPYRRVWDAQVDEYARPIPTPGKQSQTGIESSSLPIELATFDFSDYREDLWPAGELEASKRLARFCRKIATYDVDRDIPSVSGTSQLSAYLAAGVISPRQCLAAARKTAVAVGRETEPNKGIATWVSELTWRDFYTHVMFGFPRVSMHQPFKEKTKTIAWRTAENDFESWKTGNTGYPIVDGAMRQLNQTGWMHNRLRMVAAMFLCKHLLIDWRWGERYFMRKLIDGDLAANNGGWQWSASTGTDAVPYFRIFNPFSQSKRFDREGKFIKKFCPELESLPSESLHDEKKLAAALTRSKIDYPKFIVDHKSARARVLSTFKPT